jgi:hypothetical protein
MIQGIDNIWQAEARTQQTKQLIRDIKRITRRRFTVEAKISIVLEVSGGTLPSATSAAAKASSPAPIMPGSKTSWKPAKRG